MRLAGILASGETPTAQETQDAQQSLNLLIHDMAIEGWFDWRLTSESIDCVVGQASYTLTNKALGVLDVRLDLDSGSEIPMIKLTRQEYYELPDKTTQGKPTQYYLERGKDSSTIYVWPAPDDADDNILLSVYPEPSEFTASDTVPDFPEYFYNVLRYGLAVELGEEYSIPMQKLERLRLRYSALKAKANDEAAEAAPLILHPDMRYSSGYYD
jgi:hypothetical protein